MNKKIVPILIVMTLVACAGKESSHKEKEATFPRNR